MGVGPQVCRLTVSLRSHDETGPEWPPLSPRTFNSMAKSPFGAARVAVATGGGYRPPTAMHDTFRTLILVTLVAVGAVAGSAAAASDASIDASPATPGESATHTVTLTVGSSATGSLNGFSVDYSDTGTDISNVGVENVLTVGIDRDDDSSGDTIDEDVSDDMESAQGSNNGETLTVQFGGSYELSEGDEIVVVFENVQNPEAGDHSVTLDINPQSSGGEAETSLSIGDSSSGATATDTDSSGDNEMDSTDGDGSGDGSNVSGPGFGAGLTVLALLGAAFVAVRRRD